MAFAMVWLVPSCRYVMMSNARSTIALGGFMSRCMLKGCVLFPKEKVAASLSPSEIA